MIKIAHLVNEIIRPSLQALDLWSQASENLLLGTCLQESYNGTFLKQQGGIALGIYQIEPSTFDDIWQRYLTEQQPELKQNIMHYCNFAQSPDEQALIYHLTFATLICRVRYWMVAEALPDADDVDGLAYYWKRYYNTVKGKGKVDEFVEKYNKYVLNV